MERIFASPSRYVQGKGVLKDGLSHIKDLGKKVLLLTDET
ncbi:glycerol dehydrogenase, partial [Listeria monocytogenes]|nr:glycerol dehydrogenase [Listeria monocytogenes]